MKKLYSLTIGVLGLLACSEQSDLAIADLGYDYFPIDSNERIYQVEEISFDLLGSDTSRYELREFISDSVVSDQGEILYVLKREKRTSEDMNWEADSLWSVRKSDKVVVVTENNLSLAKLSFPVAENRSWDGNAFNSRSPENYLYQAVDTSLLTTSLNINQAVRVVISDIPANLVQQDQRFEVYGKGVGLLEKDYIRLNFCTTSCDSVGQVQGGRILKQHLIEYVEK